MNTGGNLCDCLLCFFWLLRTVGVLQQLCNLPVVC